MKNTSLRKIAFGKILLAAILIFSFQRSNAQLTVVDNQSAAQLVNKFVGTNVTTWGATMNCLGTHNGIFGGGGTTNLGLNGGIILSAGVVSTQNGNIGVNNTVGQFQTQDVYTTPGNPILTALSGFTTYDACILEFDFTADLDTTSLMKFDYVFGSEEYPEYACSGFNDVFAFIVTGPGIVGSPNIAVVPGTNIPVAINSINMAPNGTFYSLTNCNNMGPGSPFSQYYVDNQGQNGQFIVCDGFTTVLTAEQLIQACDTYHMFLGIANASDHVYISSVFLKENSFSVDSTTTDLSGVIPSNGGYLVEGCTPTELVYTHDTTIGRPKKICFHYGGSAINGVDVSLLPDTLMIPANVYSGSITINPLLDGLTETFNFWDPNTGYLVNTITDTLTIYEINCCTRDTLNPKDSLKIPIRDSLYMNLLTPDTFYCEGSVFPTLMHVTGDSEYDYLWTPSNTVASPTDTLTTATPVATTTYTITASYPGCPEVKREVTISLEPLPLVDIAIEDTALCVTEPVRLNVTVNPPGSPYNYSWSPIDGNLSSTTIMEPDFYYFGSGVFTYTLSVTTPNGCLGTDSIRIEAFPGVTGDIRISDTGICSNDSLVIDVIVTPQSMEATSTYQWSPSTFLSSDQVQEPTYFTTINAANTYTYTLITTNEFGCHDTDQIDIRSLILPEVKVMDDTLLCLHEATQLHMTVLPADGQFTYIWTPSTNLDDATAKEPYFFNPFNTDHADYTLYVQVTEVTGGCKNWDTLNIHTYPHVFLETVADQTIKFGSSVQLWANNTLPDIPMYYLWTPPATLDNPDIKTPVATPTEPTIYTVVGLNQFGCRDTAQVNVAVDFGMDEFVPSVFSPNGDGKNDVFRLLNMKYQKVIEFRVFNRWGKEIYNNPNPATGWDGTYNGTQQDPGVYTYLIRVNTPDGQQKMYKGNVTLVR
jgi:gliding motility-associated-like protein